MDTLSAVLIDCAPSKWFRSATEVRQRYRMAPDMFLHPMDKIMEDTIEQKQSRAHTGSELFTDLCYADDMAVLTDMLESWRLVLEDSRPGSAQIRTRDQLDEIKSRLQL